MATIAYLRVSTVDQSLARQDITDADKVFEEKLSGKDRNRPALQQMLEYVREGDLVKVWDISRLGRSLQHLVEFLNDVRSVNCHLYIHQSGLDTSTPSGRMMFQMVGVFSEFERSMISERVKLGLKRVKSKGTKLGRPTKIDDVTKEQVWNMVDEGKSLSQISKILEISKMSVSRVNRERNP